MILSGFLSFLDISVFRFSFGELGSSGEWDSKVLTFPIFHYNPRAFCCLGVSPSGKAADFDSAIPRFES